MATIIPDQGVNEREPTLIDDGALQDTDGAEYRVGQPGLFVARGRRLVATIGGITSIAIYEAGFDGNTGFIFSHDRAAGSADILTSIGVVASRWDVGAADQTLPLGL